MLEMILLAAGAYLLGSVPFGVMITRLLKGIDPREHGSRNIGFTNVLRVAGWGPGLLTLIGDMGKGYLSVAVAQKAIGDERVMMMAGLASVLGHNYPLFLKLKGGKGVATGFGVLLGLMPLIGMITLILWGSVVGVWRFSSLGAIVCFILLPIIVLLFQREISYVIFAVVLSLLILIRHRSNIVRLRQGVEPKIGGS